MKKILLENILPGIVILLIGTYVGVYVNTNKTNEENKIRFFDYQCYIIKDLIHVPDRNIINDIQVQYKDRLIENLTSISISIYNLSDKDYEDIPIYIDLTPEKNDSLEIIRNNYVGSNNLQEEIEYKGELKTKTNGKRFYYNIKTANRSPSPIYSLVQCTPVLKVSFLIIGTQKPEIEIKIIKKGLNSRQFDYSDHIQKSIFDNTFIGVTFSIVLVIVYILFIMVLIRLFRGFIRKSIERKLTHRKLYLASKLSSEFNNFKDQNDLVEQFYKLNEIYDWENSNWYSRFIIGQKKPPELK